MHGHLHTIIQKNGNGKWSRIKDQEHETKRKEEKEENLRIDVDGGTRIIRVGADDADPVSRHLPSASTQIVNGRQLTD